MGTPRRFRQSRPMKAFCLALLLTQAALAPAPAQSTQAAAVPATHPEATTTVAPFEAAARTELVLPARTEVAFELLQAVSTRTAKPGDRFELRVSQAVMVSGQVLIPAGSPALGEVIHAQKGGIFGKPGELLITVRHVEIAGQKIPMRLFQPRRARDKNGAVIAASIAIGIFAAFIQGNDIEVPAGTAMVALVARDTPIPAPTLSTPPKEEGSQP